MINNDITTRNIWRAASVMRHATPPILCNTLNISGFCSGISRLALVAVFMLLTSATAWATDYYITTNITYNGLTASDVSFTLSGNGTSFDLVNGETKSVGDIFFFNATFTITCNNPQNYDIEVSYSGSFLKIGSDPLSPTPNGNGCSFNWSMVDGDLTLNITVTSNNSYVVHFDANSGGGTMADQAIVRGVATNLSPCTFTNGSWGFTGWSTTANGSVVYADGASVTDLANAGETITLYAQWAEGFKVHFDGNGGTGTMSNQQFNFGEAQNLTANAFTREGYVFTGWNTAQNGSGSYYSDGQSVTDLTTTAGATVTLYAQWKEAISITQNGSINMPASGGIAVIIPNGVTKFYVYDDGGPSGNFSDGCNGQMLLIAPEGTVLKVNGTVTGGDYLDFGVTEYARLAVYDGSSTSATMLYHNSYGSVSNITSSNRQMLLHFYYLNNLLTTAGLSLTVEVIEPTTAHSITIADGITHGTVTADKTSAAVGETVTLTVTTDVGYELGYFTGVTVTSIGNNQYTFYMPDEDVTISASFHVSSLFGYKYDDNIFTDYIPDGSADYPYIISTAEGWNLFCDCLAEENNTTWNRFSGKTVKLGKDITVTRMAGSSGHDFCGTFDGGGNTLTFNYGSSGTPASDQYAAPFSYVSNVGSETAAIKNLHVAGDIYTSAKYAAGIVGQHWGTLDIENCRSSVVVHSSVSGDGTHGGFEAASNGTLNITGCVFDGKLLSNNTGNDATTLCGGFVGYGTCTISNSLYAPATLEDGETEPTSGSCTFVRNASPGTNCYYTRLLGTAQGTAPFIYDALPDGIGTAGETYTVSGITPYQNGIGYGGKYYTAPLATHTLTATLVGGNYWTTFYCGEADYTITTDNACAYTATAGTDEVTLTMRGTDIPMGEAVIIVGGGNGTDATISISLSKTTNLTKYDGTNDLHGEDVATATGEVLSDMSGATTLYFLSNKNSHFGFHKFAGTTVPARKAFLALDDSNVAHARELKMVFGDTTPLLSPEGEDEGASPRGGLVGAWYSLDGRKLPGKKPTAKGVYINNNRKVVVN